MACSGCSRSSWMAPPATASWSATGAASCCRCARGLAASAEGRALGPCTATVLLLSVWTLSSCAAWVGGGTRRASGPQRVDALIDCCLVRQVYLAAPRMLLPVMPHLLGELGAPDDQRRLAALELAGRLAREEPRLEEHFPEVLQEFVRRARDQQVAAWRPVFLQDPCSARRASHQTSRVLHCCSGCCTRRQGGVDTGRCAAGICAPEDVGTEHQRAAGALLGAGQGAGTTPSGKWAHAHHLITCHQGLDLTHMSSCRCSGPALSGCWTRMTKFAALPSRPSVRQAPRICGWAPRCSTALQSAGSVGHCKKRAAQLGTAIDTATLRPHMLLKQTCALLRW